VGGGSEWTFIVNSAEVNRANFCKDLDGKALCSAFYCMYTVTLYELKAIMKVSVEAGKSGVVNKTSVYQRPRVTSKK
jgi:hypothetical protein